MSVSKSSPISVVVQVPEGDEARRRPCRRRRAWPSRRPSVAADHDLHQLEAHDLGVEGVGGVEVLGWRTRRGGIPCRLASRQHGPLRYRPPTLPGRGRPGSSSGRSASAGLALARVAAVTTTSAPTAPPASRPAAASRFLAAWERSLRGTWVVDARFERVTAAGRRLDTRGPHGPAPARPARRRARARSTPAWAGARLACAPDEDGRGALPGGGPAPVPTPRRWPRSCARSPPTSRGAGALYAVREEGDCFRLRLRLRVLSPPYGERARFCFDPAHRGAGAIRDREAGGRRPHGGDQRPGPADR